MRPWVCHNRLCKTSLALPLAPPAPRSDALQLPRPTVAPEPSGQENRLKSTGHPDSPGLEAIFFVDLHQAANTAASQTQQSRAFTAPCPLPTHISLLWQSERVNAHLVDLATFFRPLNPRQKWTNQLREPSQARGPL